MFTKTFTLDRHIEELRAELRATLDMEEACRIDAELAPLLKVRDDLIQEVDATR